MQWVNSNIAAFGGDPDQITLMGQSAGAASIAFHMMSPISRNLFHRVILQSAGALADWSYTSPQESLKKSGSNIY